MGSFKARNVMIGTVKAGTLKPSNHGNLELDPGN